MREEGEEGTGEEGDERIEEEGERAGAGRGVEGGKRSPVVWEGGVQLFGDVGGSGRVEALTPSSQSLVEPERKRRGTRGLTRRRGTGTMPSTQRIGLRREYRRQTG